MGQNTLMFEVGLQRAQNSYKEIYDEVMKLVEMGGSTIKLKVQLDKATDIQKLVEQLSSLGDGTLLKPLLDRIDKLKTQLDVLGVDGSRSIERLKTEYNEATEAVQKYYRMVKQMEANIAGAKTPDLKKTFEKNLEAYKSNNKIEELTNRQVTAQLNLSAANENVAKTALAASAALSNVGQGAAIKEVKDQVDALAKGLNDIVNEMKSIGNIGGGNLVKNVSKADEKTTQIAQALTKAMQDLAAGKEGAAGKEKDLAASTRDVNQALSIEKELANETANAMNTAANAITAAAIAAKSLAVVMGGNSGDVNKFIELATRLETLNAQAKLVMQAPNMTFDAKTQSLAKTREEIELVRNEMDELKKNAAVGNPLIESFTTAFNALNQALSSSGNLLKTAAGNMGELNANIGSVISKGNIEGTVAAKKEETQAVKETTTALKEKADAEKKLVSIEQKGTVGQNNLFDPQKYTQLQEAIDKIVKEINRLREALAGIGEIQGITKLTESVNGVYHNVNSLKEVLGQLQNAFKFTASTEELAAYEAKIKSLQQTITQLESKATELTTSLNNVSTGIKTQAEKKGSEDRLADNLQKLKDRIKDVQTEFNRLNESYGQAKTMGMPTNMEIEQRLDSLRRLIQLMQQLEEAARKTENATKKEQEIRESLSKSKAFSFINFDGNQLFSREVSKLFNKKDIDAYIKSIEDFVKANGHFAQTSGSAKSATANLVQMTEAMRQSAERANGAERSFSSTAAGLRNFAVNVETARLAYDKTLRGIADLESRISAAQKANMDKDTIEFMQGLKQRAQQWANVLKEILGKDMNGNTMYKEFLSMSGNILTSPQIGNMFQSLLGSDWKILLKDIGSTFNMLMKFSGFNKELTLDNASLSNWLKAEEAVRRLDNALKDLNRQWEATNKESRSPDLTARYETQKRAIESLIAQLKGAMTDEARMANRNGLADLLGVGFKNAVGYDNKRLIQDLKATGNDAASAESRIRKLGMAFNELKGYIQANGGSEAMRKLQTEIQQAIQKMRQLMNAGDFSGAVQVFERISGAIRQATQETRIYEKEQQRAQQQTSSATHMANTSLNQQSQILSDLKTMAMQYVSIWGAQSFLNNIIELGGQLEQQRLSIGAILQDSAQANYLFGQIKDLAIKSPFGVQQLDAMTKQLSAYGFQYSELFEWTKRLADISAATGTSVDRLALALGHVRSEGALSGYTLRQFSMGNIPLLEKLSKNLGKTKAEIRKMTRSKEIEYEDVLDVLKQLTDEGGMFYNAQETMAQALNAKFKNLRDSFQIMYSEMAEGAPGDALKRVAEVLTDMSKSWRVLMPMIASGTAAFALWKGTTFFLNYQLERTGKLLVGNALATSKYSVNQLRAIATTGRWTVALRGLGSALMSVGKFLFHPVTLGIAAVEGLVYLWSKHNEEVRKAKDLTKAYGDEAVESEKNISNQLEKIKPFSNNLNESVLKNGIEQMTESIKNYAVNGQEIINAMLGKDSEGRVMSLADRYKYLRNELENTINVYRELKRVKDAFEYGINESDGGWLDDNVESDLTKYSEAYKKFIDDVTSYNAKYNNSIADAINNARNSDAAFREATKNMQSYGDMLAEFWSNPYKYKDAAKFMNNLYGTGGGSQDALNINESFFRYLNKRGEAMKELDQFMENTETRLKEKGYDFSKGLAPEQVGALLKMSKEWLDKHPEWDGIYDTIKEKLEGRWPIKIVPDTDPIEEELPKWIKDFQEELKGTGITLTADMDMEQIIDAMKKAYDQAQTTVNKLEPIALHAKIKIDGLSDKDIEEYNNPLSYKYNPELYNTLKDLKSARTKKSTIDNAAEKRGVTLEGMKKDGSHKDGSKEDKQAKEMREQIKLVKDAYDWYKKYDDQLKWSAEDAFGEIKKKYGATLGQLGIKWDDEKKGITEYRDSLQALLDKAEALYKQPKHKNSYMMDVIKELKDAIQQTDFDKLKKNAEDTASAMSNILNRISQQWSVYKSVLSATGNRGLAQQMAGLTGIRSVYNTQAEHLKGTIKSDVPGVDFSKVFTMSDKEIEEYVGTLGLVKNKIDGVINSLKEWKKLQNETISADINSFSTLLGGLKDYDSEILKIDAELEEQKKANERLATIINPETGKPYITQEQKVKADRVADVLAEDKKWQKSSEYVNLINNTLALTKAEIEQGLVNAQSMLNKKLEEGVITVKEYADEMAKLKSLQENWDKGSIFGKSNVLTNYLTGGESGMRNYLTQTISKYIGKKDLTEGEKKQYNNALDTQKGLDKLDKSVGKTKAVFDTLAGALQPLIDIFNQLGMTGIGQVVGGVQGAMSGAATGGMAGIALGGAAGGPIGAAIGAGLSVTSTILGGILSAHDDALQDEIDASKQRQKEMERLSKNVEKVLENVLGGLYTFAESDTTERERKEVVDEYSRRRSKDIESDEYAKEFVKAAERGLPMVASVFAGMVRSTRKQAGEKDTVAAFKKAAETQEYYDIQRATMLAQRDELARQRNAEQDKKDSDNDAIDNYNQQIRELEDNLRTFALDMAKALYDIDLKDWASQLTDAVVEAWEKGENAAEAYRKKVKEIVKDLTKNMLAQKVVEAAFKASGLDKMIENLMDAKSGVLGTNEFMQLADGVNAVAESTTKTITGVLDAMERKGYIDKGNGSSSGVSSNIKSITEQTADLLASYINAIRADVSVNRSVIAQYLPMIYQALTSSGVGGSISFARRNGVVFDEDIASQYFPMLYQSLTAGNSSLRNIEEHTSAIMESNNAIKESNQAILDRINGLKNNSWQIPVA